jgi:hypothetical protein
MLRANASSCTHLPVTHGVVAMLLFWAAQDGDTMFLLTALQHRRPTWHLHTAVRTSDLTTTFWSFQIENRCRKEPNRIDSNRNTRIDTSRLRLRPWLHWSQNRHNTANQHLSGQTFNLTSTNKKTFFSQFGYCRWCEPLHDEGVRWSLGRCSPLLLTIQLVSLHSVSKL